jgi:hypothetical protein
MAIHDRDDVGIERRNTRRTSQPAADILLIFNEMRCAKRRREMKAGKNT